MNCPHCNKIIDAMTGFQEASKFQKHLGKCRKNPNNIVLSYGNNKVTVSLKEESLFDALKLRSDSNQ